MTRPPALSIKPSEAFDAGAAVDVRDGMGDGELVENQAARVCVDAPEEDVRVRGRRDGGLIADLGGNRRYMCFGLEAQVLLCSKVDLQAPDIVGRGA